MERDLVKEYLKWISSVANEFFNEQINTIKKVALDAAEVVWYRVNHLLSQVEKLNDAEEEVKDELYSYSIKINYVADQLAKMIEEVKKNDRI